MARASHPLPLLLAGLFLLLLGAAWLSIAPADLLPRLALVCGALLLIVFAVRHWAEIRYLLLQAHRHSEPGPTTTLLLAALVLALAALVLGRTLLPVDLTTERVNSLTEASRTALAALRGPLDLDAFFIEDSPQWEVARRYLELYQRGSGRVRVSLSDPDREPHRARSLGATRAGLVIVRYGDSRTEVDLLNEEAITAGILRVLEGRPRRVGLTQRHGEPLISGGGDTGITAWMSALREANVDAQEVDLLGSPEALAALDALLIVHPQHPLYPSEIVSARRYLEGGGRIGLWLEPGDSTGLEDFLAFYSLRLLPGTIRDRGRIAARLEMGPWATALVGAPGHEITSRLGTFPVAVEARAMQIVSPHPMELIIEPLLMTAKHPQDEPERLTVVAAPGREEEVLASGVQVVGAAIAWEVPVGEEWSREPDSLGLPPVKPEARVLVIGDGSLVTNRYFGVGANQSLAINAVHWLTVQNRLLPRAREIPPPVRLRLGRSGLRILLYAVEFGLPLALAVLGLAVWLRRRGGGVR